MPRSIHACLKMSKPSHDPVPLRRKVFWVILKIFSLSMQVEKVASVAIYVIQLRIEGKISLQDSILQMFARKKLNYN
jgi:hypothetical protein